MLTNTLGARPRRARLALLLASLLALGSTGCQTTKVAYSFQPLAHATPAELPPAPAAALPAAASTPAPNVAAAAAAAMPTTARSHSRGLQHHLPTVASARRVARAATLRPQQQQLRHSPQAPAEQGLGLTVVGLLGMVAVVVGLIGVVLGGGPAWIVVAGLGALAVLLAWLIPKSQQ